MSLASVGYRQVESIVETWTKKYQYHISLLQSKPNEVRFMVEFSLPQPQKPVPIGTIRVYFTCKDKESLNITFRFQKDSLIHSGNKTIRHQEMEKWIDDALSKKLLVRETVFYLGTSYESTRVRDLRQDKVLEEKVIPEEVEFIYIHPDLLSDQQRVMDVMEKPQLQGELKSQLVAHFKQIDQDNIGVLTHSEFIQLIHNLGIKLSPQEQKQLLLKVDHLQTGMVQFENYHQVALDFFQALEAKKAAEFNLQIAKDEEVFGSILMLINDQVQDIEEMLIAKFQAKDQDQTGVTNISEVKSILEEINKKMKEEKKEEPMKKAKEQPKGEANKNGKENNKKNKQEPKQELSKVAKESYRPEPLNAIEMAEITKILTDLYGYKEIPYGKIHKHIIDLKIAQLTNGRINSRMNNLEMHLRQIFDKYDQKKFGKIKLQFFEEALKKSQKVKLTKAQIYLLKNITPVDNKELVSYIECSKFLAETIKKFYIHSSKRKQ